MSHPNQIIDSTHRTVQIAQEKASSDRTHGVVYRGRRDFMPVIRLPLHVPIYRMANGRTDVVQLEYITEHGLDPEFFAAGEENLSAQKAQHGILLAMSKASTGPIYQELEEVARQDEPLLITAAGVVVNGNRRLAAMRDLFGRDAVRFKSFSHVDVAVLPESATDLDLEVIEAQLQMVRDTKLQYGWVEERRKLRRLRDHFGRPITEISDLMRVKEDDVSRQIEELELAEEYLQSFAKEPGAYRLVATSEQLFKELAKELQKKKQADKELARLIGFNLVRAADSLDNRAYHFRDTFGRNATEVIRRLAMEEGLDLGTDNDTPDHGFDPDDPLLGLEGDIPAYVEPLKTLLADADRSVTNAKRIAAIHQNIKNEKEDEDARTAALNSVVKAHRILQKIDWTTADPAHLRSIGEQLTSMIRLAESLRDEIRSQSARPVEVATDPSEL